MVSLETLLQRFEDHKELSLVQHNIILEKIDHLETKFDSKIISLEKSSEEFKTWRNYGIVIIALIGFITPVIAQYLLK